MIFGRVARKGGNHAMSVTTRMSEKDRALGRVDIPLSRGAIEPVDATAFRGVSIDVRGDGDYQLIASAYGAPTSTPPSKPRRNGGRSASTSLRSDSLKPRAALARRQATDAQLRDRASRRGLRMARNRQSEILSLIVRLEEG